MADSACCTDLECSGSHESSIDILKPREAGQRKFSALLRRHTCHTVRTLKPSSLLPTAICINSHHLTNHIRFQVGVTTSVWTIFSASNRLQLSNEHGDAFYLGAFLGWVRLINPTHGPAFSASACDTPCPCARCCAVRAHAHPFVFCPGAALASDLVLRCPGMRTWCTAGLTTSWPWRSRLISNMHWAEYVPTVFVVT